MAKSRSEKASDTLREREGWRGRGVSGGVRREGNVKDQCHQDCGPLFVSVATSHPIVCWLRVRVVVLMVVGGASESMTVNKQGKG